VVKLSWFIKIRSYAKSEEELWLEEWKSPWARTIDVDDPKAFLASLQAPIEQT
jgi:proteasome activator subunit 4